MPTDWVAHMEPFLDPAHCRPSWKEYFMVQAVAAASRSTCTRVKTGAVVVRDHRVVASGYNGALAGEPHCEHPDDQPCRVSAHAEANLVYWAAREGISLKGAEMYCCLSPCKNCAFAIIQSGISKLTYLKEYRDLHGVLFLMDRIEVVYYPDLLTH